MLNLLFKLILWLLVTFALAGCALGPNGFSVEATDFTWDVEYTLNSKLHSVPRCAVNDNAVGDRAPLGSDPSTTAGPVRQGPGLSGPLDP